MPTSLEPLKRPPGTGQGGTPPPVEHQFQPGQSGNPKGRPRTIAQLREHIQEIGEQPSGAADMTKLDVLLRQMFASKSATDRLNILKYGWGNVPLPIGGSVELGPIKIEAIEAYSYESALTTIAARPDEDSLITAQDVDGSDGAAMG